MECRTSQVGGRPVSCVDCERRGKGGQFGGVFEGWGGSAARGGIGLTILAEFYLDLAIEEL